MRNRIFVIILCAFLCLPAPARAGCAAPPPDVTSLKVASCRFYHAVEDEQLVQDVRQYYAKFFADTGDDERAQRMAETLASNTGAIVTGVRADVKDTAQREYFFRTSDTEACAQFETGKSYDVEITQTCPMVFFAAPVSSVITLADGKARTPLFAPDPGEGPVPETGRFEAPQSDGEVLAWAEKSVRDIFGRGAPAGAENPFPTLLQQGAWKNLPGQDARGLKPVADDLKLSNPVILQVGTMLTGPGRLWTVDWDADFKYETGDGKTHHARHLRLVLERTPENPSGLAITAVTVTEGEIGETDGNPATP